MTDNVLAQLAALKTMPVANLKRKWRDLFASEPPPYNRRFLEHRLAYRIQELTYGGLKSETVNRLEALADGLESRLSKRRRIEDRPVSVDRGHGMPHALRNVLSLPRTRSGSATPAQRDAWGLVCADLLVEHRRPAK